MTPLGKPTVIKLPKLTHLSITFPTPSKQWITKLEKLFFQFIWNGINDKISRTLLIQKYTDGGLQMVHLESYIKSLKLSWFRRILQSTDDLLNTLFGVITKSTVSKFLQMGSDCLRNISKYIHNFFWKESLLAFS